MQPLARLTVDVLCTIGRLHASCMSSQQIDHSERVCSAIRILAAPKVKMIRKKNRLAVDVRRRAGSG
eukprot:3361112-Pleurochrysis_carterae.AAC.4